MSVVAKQLQESSFYSPRRQWQQQRSKTFACCHHEQLNRKQSVESLEKQKVTRKIEEKVKLLPERALIAQLRTIEKPENNSAKSKNRGVEKTIFSQLEDNSNNLKEHENSKSRGQPEKFLQKDVGLESRNNVAEICLMNGQHILFKMPEKKLKSASHNKNLDVLAAPQNNIRALQEQADEYIKETEKENRKLYRYFRRKRSRVTKIAPIYEESEDLNSDEANTLKAQSKLYCLKMQSCWQAHENEIETYQTRTKIIKRISNPRCESKPISEQSSPTKVLKKEKPKKLREIQTISGSVSQSSLQCKVSLHKYGSLIECHNSNGDNTNSKTPLETLNNHRRRKCPRLANILGLLRPFRGKYRQPKPKIEAVVYKTYFVKWTKPPDSLANGYGVKPLKSSNVEMSVLRRCRSAIF